jgi:phosphate transport system substrate-binding protein
MLPLLRTGAPALDLPPYRARHQVSGTIRSRGNGFAGLWKKWEEGFRVVQPDVRFDDLLPTSDLAFPALVTGAADLGPNGGEPSLTETLSFFEVHGHHATQIAVATGAYDVEGRSNGIVVYVHRDNPISRLTMGQLDSIFGAERTGALRGFKWTLGDARGADTNIRTWGQLGLTGEWAARPIQTYGHAPSGTSRFFQLQVMHNSAKWNPNYREYVETGSKMIGDDDAEQRGGLRHMAGELARDRYGIAWTVVPQAQGTAGIKPLAIAQQDGGPYVVPSTESFRDRSYPLARSVYVYLNRAPGRPLDAKLEEFLRFILSREGQEIVARDGGYLPLPGRIVHEQLASLDER